ncbi:hypothetical protein HMPREF9442_01475 [Paraprevotella xylaniphila YIT 11841]|uniref:Uncharacterized protein n=1 Tax=Paraprevotella xylaniphila YIT 11841 TaxID=762982 RepID=F3QTF8_9BACT|nr:hypothetical protein HMPREF9442_01475 [Paraprevotella xylaniphila YIT 11841]
MKISAEDLLKKERLENQYSKGLKLICAKRKINLRRMKNHSPEIDFSFS